MSETLSIADDDGPEPPAARPAPLLFLVFQAHHPLGESLRVALQGLDAVVLGRGEQTSAAQESEGVVAIRLDDPWMSTTHARLQPVMARWRLEDAGSKNGTAVNGQPLTAPRVLADGDLVTVGRSFLLFRTEVAVGPDDRRIAVAEAAPQALRTLLPPLARQYAALRKIAGSTTSVVIAGPTGSGKEMVARAVHELSGRSGPFVAVNCGALPETLVETEIFGYRRGAFSGAHEDRIGYVRSAHGGTLFLDEVGELPPPAQVALLRVLQEREVTPVGATRPLPVDLRLVSATHRDLDSLITSGTLREDFYHRLTGFRVELPPLGERLEDLGMLVAAIIRRHARDAAAVRFDHRVARLLFRYPWPGSVRELERTLEAAFSLAGDSPIAPEHLPSAMAAPSQAPAGGGRSLPSDEEAHRDRLVELLEAHGGNISAVARELGKAPVQIRRWLKRYALDPSSFRR